MEPLNFPEFQFQVFDQEEKTWIYDIFRKKHVVLTPEEWVRQHVLMYLVRVKNYPQSLISVERMIAFNKLKKRFDAMVYGKDGKPFMLIECKAPEVNLSSETLFQIATYNMVFKVPYLFVSNGKQHLLFGLNEEGRYVSIPEIPVI